MLKTHSLRKLAIEEGGEYVLGMKDLKTHACYLIYGELQPGEKGRKICPGTGHEEILMTVIGDIEVTGEPFKGVLHEGEAIHLREEQTCLLANPGKSRAIYILAGGHSGIDH